MDQVARDGVFIATDHPPGRAVQEDQPVQAVADQDPMHRGGGHAQAGSDPGRAEPFTATQPQDPLLQVDWSSMGAAMRDAGPVDQPGLAELLVAGPPPGRGGAGDPHLMGDLGDRARIGLDPPDQDALPAGVRRALACAMRPPMSAVP